MAYKHINSRGQDYYLHMKDVMLKGGLMQRIYYFGRHVDNSKGTPIDEVPAGRIIVENARTGLPVLKKG